MEENIWVAFAFILQVLFRSAGKNVKNMNQFLKIVISLGLMDIQGVSEKF